MSIPAIIKQQLFATGAVKVLSWGAHLWSKPDELTLLFKVQTRRFHGLICIVYNEGMDEYNLYFYDNKTINSFLREKKPSREFKPIHGVYFDQMVDLIDERIEKIAAYVA